MSQYETLEVTQDGSVMVIALNRPEKMNTFNIALRREIAQAAIAANLDESVRAVVLTGNGRAFSAGADLSDGDGMANGKSVESDLNFEYKPGVLAIHNSSMVHVLVLPTHMQWPVTWPVWARVLIYINPSQQSVWCQMVAQRG